jgi:3-(3-hydroxy-phenyl)propionate hydroxylase
MWVRGPVALPPRCIQYCRPARPATYIQGPGDLRRWEIKMLPGETPLDFEGQEAVLRVLSEFVDTAHLELCRHAVYRFHALVAEDWRRGRVLLMGDAAHQMPPFLGQGMCAGIRDASNLAWKLDAVLAGRAPARLLDTYGEERKRHVRTVVAHAKSFGLIIGELDEAAARERDRRLGDQLASGHAETVRQRFTPGLQTGLIAHTPDAQPARGAGDLFPQPWVRTADAAAWQRLDELTGAGFRVVLRNAQIWHGLPEHARAFWSAMGGRTWLLAGPGQLLAQGVTGGPGGFCERDGVLAAWLRGHEAAAVVVRPDHYVYGMARDGKELAALIEGLRQACAGERAVEAPVATA